MAIKVKINPDVFKNHISALEAKKTEMLMDALQITQAVFNLDGTYDGQASEAFKAEWNDMYQQLKQNDDKMQEVIDDLKQGLETYIQQEEAARSAMSSLDTGSSYMG